MKENQHDQNFVKVLREFDKPISSKNAFEKNIDFIIDIKKYLKDFIPSTEDWVNASMLLGKASDVYGYRIDNLYQEIQVFLGSLERTKSHPPESKNVLLIYIRLYRTKKIYILRKTALSLIENQLT